MAKKVIGLVKKVLFLLKYCIILLICMWVGSLFKGAGMIGAEKQGACTYSR